MDDQPRLSETIISDDGRKSSTAVIAHVRVLLKQLCLIRQHDIGHILYVTDSRLVRIEIPAP